MRRHPVFAKETGNEKTQVVTILLIHWVAKTHIDWWWWSWWWWNW